MLDGIMLIWFVLTFFSLVFVVIDIRSTPESPVLKWAFSILVLFSGPIGAFFYVLGCREPFKGAHEQYVSARWKQVLGSTMHCAAGDGLGIMAGAVIGAYLQLAGWVDISLEYILGFGFGWAFFQAFAMKDMAGGSYIRSLKMTFLPEFLSMNLLMAGMTVTMSFLMVRIEAAHHPAAPEFWFVMSMSLMVGFVLAYPVNWWLVVNGLKHGMFTVPGNEEPAHMSAGGGHDMSDMSAQGGHGGGGSAMKPSKTSLIAMTIFSILCLGVGLAISLNLGG